MNKAVLVFEDSHWPALAPLTDLVPVPALAFGASSLAERLATAAGQPLAAIAARAGALAVCRSAPRPANAFDADVRTVLCLNAAAQPGPWLRDLAAGEDVVLVRQGERV